VDDVTVADDGLARCPWGASGPELLAYHDDEWGRPVADDARVYEKLCLEGFQAGLSWITVLRKRDAFRRAFASFAPDAVARFDDADVERLVTDASIVRNRAKIVAAVTNARSTVSLQAAGGSLGGLVWSYRPAIESVPERLGDLHSSTAESKALSAELRRLGFAFVGPTTVYSTMQSLGVVNDHLRGCHWHDVVERERAGFSPPAPGRR
jgi:DNA-3-methyladenine glycosylase I